ncbi:MAG TPA: poly-gamma-glutamate hydrolase family protein [Longimicrobiales bacterium]
MFRELLERDDVEEVLELRGRVGFLAFHGGALERVTDVVAEEAAARADASLYVIRHPEGVPHVPSSLVDPAHSSRLRAFLEHVSVAIAVHGYGRDDRRRHVLIGGRNRRLAHHLRDHLVAALPDYDHVTDLDQIPRELRGLHPGNPVNRPRHAGAQIELPPVLRWHREQWGWSDTPPIGRAPQVDLLIDALARAANAWR